MSEVKGQLLGIALVLMVFGAVSGVIASIFTNLKTTVKNKADTVLNDANTTLSATDVGDLELLTYYESSATR